MKVFAFDPYIDPVIIKNDGVVSKESVEELYKKCEYISIHIPANAETRGSVNFDFDETDARRCHHRQHCPKRGYG